MANRNTNIDPENIVKGKIANALTSAAKDHIVATADDLYDTEIGMYQDEINRLSVSGSTELSGAVVDIEERLVVVEGEVDVLQSGVTEILDELQYVAQEATLISGITEIEDAIAECCEASAELITSSRDEILSAVTNLDLTEVAKEGTLVSGITEILDAIDNVDLSEVAKEGTLVSGITDTLEKLENVLGLEGDTMGLINTQANNVINVVNSQAQGINSNISSQAGAIIDNNNAQTSAINGNINGKAEGISNLVNEQTSNIIRTVNTQAQSIANDIVNLGGEFDSGLTEILDAIDNVDLTEVAKQGENTGATNTEIYSTVDSIDETLTEAIDEFLGNVSGYTSNREIYDALTDENSGLTAILTAVDNIDIDTTELAKENTVVSGITRIIDAITVIKEELQGENSGITLTYLYDMIGDLSTLLDEINGEEMPVEFATDYARQGDNSGATNTAILESINGGSFVQEVIVDNTVLSQEIEPNVIYTFPNRSNNLTITLGTPQQGQAAIYHFMVEIGDTVPTLTLPSGLSYKAPITLLGNTTFEISILNNYVMYTTW